MPLYAPQSACQSISIPAKSGLKHFTELQTNEGVSCDISDAKPTGVSIANRNGAALWYSGSNADTGISSRIGIFKDSLEIPNIYYFLDLNSERARQFFGKGIINGGRGASIFLLERPGSDIAGYFAGNFRMPDHYFLCNSTGGTQDVIGRKYNLKKTELPFVFQEDLKFFGEAIYPNKGTSGIDWDEHDSYFNFNKSTLDVSVSPLKLMQFIETKKYTLNRPIIFAINSQDFSAMNILKEVQFSFSIISKILPVFGQAAGVVADLLNKAMNTYIALSNGSLNLQSGILLVNCLAQMADMIAPETVKGIRNQAQENIGSILKFSKDTVAGLFTTVNPMSNGNMIDNIAKQLNTTAAWVKNIYVDYSEDVQGYANIVNKFSGDQFNYYKNALANVKNITLIDHATRAARQTQNTASKLEQEITSAPYITSVPILKDLFIAGSANTILPTLPNSDNIVKSVLANHQQEIRNWGEKGKQMEAMISTMSMGYTPPSQVFDEFALEGLRTDAIKFRDAGQKYILPDSIPEEKKDCYVYELQGTGADVIPCRKGEVWDHAKRKCVMQNASISVAMDFLTPKNLIIASGIVGAGLLAKKMIKG